MADVTTPGGPATAGAPGAGYAPPTGAESQSQSAAGQAQEKAQEAVGQAKDKAQEAAGQAKEKAQEATQQARSRVRDEVDRRSTEAGERVNGTGSDLRSVAEQLREQGKEQPAKIAEQAADRTERLGGYLHDADADRILGDVEDFARRQPWAVAAAGLALGFAASRFLKASSSDRYRTRQSTPAGRQPSELNGHSTAPVAPPLAPPVASPAPPAPMPPMPPVPPSTPPSAVDPPTVPTHAPVAPPVPAAPPHPLTSNVPPAGGGLPPR